MNYQKLEDPTLLISQFYSGVYTPTLVPQQGEVQKARRRRRRKNRGGGGNEITGTRKRKLSSEQVNLLELYFGNEHKLESERKDKLASELGLDPRQVAVWFQNRRARWKNKKLEEEYAKLKTSHETFVVEKCRLESEVLKLKEQLNEAEKEMQRLLELFEGVSSNSPSSSVLSVEVINQVPQYFGTFGTGLYEDVMFMPQPDQGNYILGMDWANLYM